MTKEAWTTFWQHGLGDGACIPGAADTRKRLQQYWITFAGNFEKPSHLVDLACGGGMVAKRLADANEAITVTGVDFADVPASDADRVILKSGTDIADLPFKDESLDGAVSQFGIEYADPAAAGAELSRILKPGALFAFLMHHKDSQLVADNAARAAVLGSVTQDTVRDAYVAGERQALAKAMFDIRLHSERKDVVDEIARGLGQSMINSNSDGDRLTGWNDFERLAQGEMAILDALAHAAIEQPEAWLEQLGSQVSAEGISIFKDWRDEPVAWSIFGRRT